MHQGQYAVIAGGSKGIGYSIAEALGRRNYNLVLIGRHEDALIQAKRKLEHQYLIHVEILIKDLSNPESANEIAKLCEEKKLKVTLLCNVAGIGGARDFLHSPLEDIRYMIHLNVESVMALTSHFLPTLEKNAPSHILNVASMAGFAPIPIKNMYSATKSAIIYFSYNLHYQLREKNIQVSCLCPGPVSTKEEIVQDTIDKLGWLGKSMMLAPSQVGEEAVRRTLNGRLLIVPGFLAKLISIVIRALPRRVIVFMYYKLSK
jgi:short-subunit dehydrogenase